MLNSRYLTNHLFPAMDEIERVMHMKREETMKITKGPWKHYDDTSEAGKTNRHEIVALGKTVARIYATKGCEEEDTANARAIAEVPAMIDILQRVIDQYVDTDAPLGLDAAAILKRIEGEK